MTTCKWCDREIRLSKKGNWIDPEAKGDDRFWRLTCDSHDTFLSWYADHEPKTSDVPGYYETGHVIVVTTKGGCA